MSIISLKFTTKESILVIDLSQERTRLFRKYPKNPHLEDDLAEVQRLLRQHNKWVENGDGADRETYPLAHKAYLDDLPDEDADQGTSGEVTADMGTSGQKMSNQNTSDNGTSGRGTSGGGGNDSTGSMMPDQSSNANGDDSKIVDEMFASNSVKSKPNITNCSTASSDVEPNKTKSNVDDLSTNEVPCCSPVTLESAAANEMPCKSQVTIDELFADSGRPQDSRL